MRQEWNENETEMAFYGDLFGIFLSILSFTLRKLFYSETAHFSGLSVAYLKCDALILKQRRFIQGMNFLMWNIKSSSNDFRHSGE